VQLENGSYLVREGRILNEYKKWTVAGIGVYMTKQNPSTKLTDRLLNQTNLEAKRKARENVCERVTTDFGFTLKPL